MDICSYTRLGLVALLVIWPASSRALDQIEKEALAISFAQQQTLKGSKRISFGSKFEPVSTGAAAAPLTPAVNDGYVSLRYALGSATNREYIEAVLTYISQTLPATFGNTAGTYTITITIKDKSGNSLVREPVISFQWSKERGFLFFDKAVSEVQKASWSGTLVSFFPITPATDRLRVAVEVSAQKNRSLDFDMIKKTAKSASAGALAALFPLPAAALPMLDTITDIANQLYAGSETKMLVSEEEIFLAAGKPLKAPVTFTDQNGNRFVLPIVITIENRASRFVDKPLAGGKFAAGDLSDSIFTTASMAVGTDKTVNIIELISTSSDPRYARTRSMLDSLIAGGTYGRDPAVPKEADLAARCNDLYDALQRYLSKYDARAMYWAFLERFGGSIRKEACLTKSRGDELAAVGLQN